MDLKVTKNLESACEKQDRVVYNQNSEWKLKLNDSF